MWTKPTSNRCVYPRVGGGGGQDFRSNSFGGQVMPTISVCEYKMGQKQKDTTGGYVMHMFLHAGVCGRSTSSCTTPDSVSAWGAAR